MIESWTALGELERGAVHGTPARPHDTLAACAAGGAGAVYRLRAGDEGALEASRATWHDKPPGTTYEDVGARLGPAVAVPGSGWWQRALVLGPAPEFCLLSAAPPATELPEEAVVVERQRVV